MPPFDDTITTAPDVPVSAPPPSQPAAAPPEPPSLRDTLAKAVETTLPEGLQEGRPTETPVQRTQRLRDAQGKFTRRNADGSEVPSEAQVEDARLSLDPDAEDGEEAPAPHEEALPSTDNAPKSWKAVAKEKWATVDPVVRAEVHRREREATRAIADAAPVKKFVGEFQQVVQPFAQHYAESGLTPLALMRNLMQADVHLSTAAMPDRARFMAKLIKDYRIDINMLDAALAGSDPGQEPMAGVERLLNERLAPVQQFVQTEQQRRESVLQMERQRAQTVLQRMEADSANFPHFSLVAQDMADVTELAMKRGVYLSPQEAYNRAVALNPEAQAAEQSRSGQQRAREAHDAATRSLGASLSVSGSSAGLKQSVEPSDLRGTIAAAWEAAQGR